MPTADIMYEQGTVLVPVVAQEGAKLPQYATGGAAGADLYANLSEPLDLLPGGRCIVPTGLSMAIPEGFELQIRSRSGLAWKHGIMVLNSPGTIDHDYRGEVQVILFNTSHQIFVVEPGMRIAQAVLAPMYRIQWIPSEGLPSSERGSGGFGHSGTH